MVKTKFIAIVLFNQLMGRRALRDLQHKLVG